jgi:hypothetical protein
MCYGVAWPEPTGREFAGFESVEGGVRGVLILAVVGKCRVRYTSRVSFPVPTPLR